MPPSMDSPIRTRIAIPVPDGVGIGGKNGAVGIPTRSGSRRRIFVQTDAGSVLGIELDRADNAQTVKKKMQTLLNVPTDQTALVFGDTIYKGDLSEVRNDSPLLLTRELQRSLSTPCIYPPADVQGAVDGGQPLEVVGGLRCSVKMKQIIRAMKKAISCGVEPLPVSGGLGGAYYFRNVKGHNIAIVKPTDEEPFAPNNPKGYAGRSLGQPGLKKAVRVGETGVREVAAYLLDRENFAKVPPTMLVKVSHHAFHVNGAPMACKGWEKIFQPVAKIASCQQFVHHDCDASDHGTSRFSVAAVHRIGILDVRIFNTDRHAGNILIRNVNSDMPQRCSNAHVSESLELIPIDHGLCLPEALEDPYFEWLHWPQASLPFSEEELDYIRRLDEYRDADELRCELPMLREACLRMLILSTTLLKRSAAAGLCLAEIGEMMSRDGIEEASELELLCMKAKFEIEKGVLAEQLRHDGDHNDVAVSEISGGEELREQFEFEMDQDFGYKLNVVPHQSQLLPQQNETVNMNPDPFGFPLLSESGHGLFSSPDLMHSSPAVMESWPEVTSVKEFGDLSLTPQASAGGPSSDTSKFQPSQTLKLKADMSSPNSSCIKRGPRMSSDFCPVVEEEEVTFPYNGSKSSESTQEKYMAAPRPMPLRGASFRDRKQRYLDFFEHKTPASETTGKFHADGGYPPFSPGDLTEEEWICFMGLFERLLEQALVSRHNRSVCHRPRLGISCQF